MRGKEDLPWVLKSWIWLLILILLLLLLVPVFSIGLAVRKSGWVPGHKSSRPNPQTAAAPPFSLEEEKVRQNSISLRQRIENITEAAIKIPRMQSKMQQVKIETPAPSMKRASDFVHQVLDDQRCQFVEAVDPDRIRIIAILTGKEWPALSAQLQSAAKQDGFVYHGPNQTATAVGADSMVAEIEILRKPSHSSKKDQ